MIAGPEQLLVELLRLGARLSLEQGRLRCRAAKGVLNDELRQAIGLHKSGLMELLAAAREEEPAPAPKPGGQAENAISHGQERLLFLERLGQGGAAYHIPGALLLEGELDRQALARALARVVQRHQVLRTVFDLKGSAPLPRLLPTPEPHLPVTDLSDLVGQAKEQRLQDLAQAQARAPFDLSTSPLIRWQLLSLGPGEHVLLLTLHHLAADAWSLEVLMAELGQLYGALVGQGQAPPPLPAQYADFAAWQRGRDQQKELGYWLDQLAAPLPVLQMPRDFPAPSRQDLRGNALKAGVEPGLLTGLQGLAVGQGASLFMALLAAWALLLSRQSGQDDLVVGVPVAGRQQERWQGLLGFFLNTLPLRLSLSGEQSFGDFLGQVRDKSLAAFEHQEIPFEALLESLHLERSLARPPVFEVMFNHITSSPRSWQWPGLKVRLLDLHQPGAKFPLALYARQDGQDLELELVYQTALFAPRRMGLLLEQYLHLLRQIAADSGKRLACYSLVTPGQEGLLPNPAAPLPARPFAPPSDPFLRTAAERPDRVALQGESRLVTYGRLSQASQGLASRLLAAGLAPGQVVGIACAQAEDLVCAMLAVLMAGGVMLNLDPAHPVQRNERVLGLAGAAFLLGDRRGALALPAGCARLQWRGLDEPGTGQPMHPLPRLRPEQAGYVFFTSGSTGRPKGILGSHQGISHFVDWQQREFSLGPQDRVAQVTAPGFDAILREVFGALTCGARLCLPSPAQAMEPRAMAQWIRDSRVSVINTAPSRARAWLQAAPAGPPANELRYLFLAGEHLSDRLALSWREVFGQQCRVVNLYGPSETTMTKCFFRVPEQPLPGPQPAGRALPQTQALVLDQDKPCGVGELGEVVIRTPFMALGYLDPAEPAAGNFTRNPIAGDRMYRTGDLGRYDAEGLLHIVGRRDQQVKIAGVRVEPGEVVAALEAHPLVFQAAVLPLARGEDLALAAYVCPAGETPPTASELRAFVAQRLPAALAPASITILAAMPLLPNGKLDAKALPRPLPERKPGGPPPASAMEKEVARVWSEVLGLGRVNLGEDFFALGGHSLKAAQVVARLNARFQVELPLASLFETPTIEGLALRLQNLTSAARDANLPAGKGGAEAEQP